ncbi:MAG: hypothetical protein KGJ66_01250 [Alphaproteobacteria bacterium]|nr:hypothetical protein [Alphaproteobacteria bacterium]
MPARKMQVQIQRERAKSILIVVTPAVLYLAYLVFVAATELRRRHADAPRKAMS